MFADLVVVRAAFFAGRPRVIVVLVTVPVARLCSRGPAIVIIIVVVVIAATTTTIMAIMILAITASAGFAAFNAAVNDARKIVGGDIAASRADDDPFAVEDPDGITVALAWVQLQQLYHGLGHDVF